MRRILRWVLRSILALLLLLMLAVAWVISSEGASVRLLRWGLARPGMPVTIRTIRGPLKGPLHLGGVVYRSAALAMLADSVTLEWAPSQLLLGRVAIRRLDIGGVSVTLNDSVPPDSAPAAARSRIHSPVAVHFDTVTMRDIAVRQGTRPLLAHGSIDLAGSLSDYRVTLRGTATAPRIGAVPLVIQASGNLDALRESVVEARALEGTVRGSGTAGWWPEIRWDMALSADTIRPGQLLADSTTLRGAIAIRARTHGSYDSGGIRATLTLDSLGGALRGLPLSGHADASVVPGRIDLQALQIGWGTSLVDAAGNLADSMVALQWHLAVNGLRDFVPDASGDLLAEGRIAGTRNAPLLQATFSGTGLRVGTSELRRLHGHIDGGITPDAPLDLRILGEAGRTGSTVIRSIDLQVRGATAHHQLTLSTLFPADTLHVAAAGAWRSNRWIGTLDRLDLLGVTAGTWRLQQRVAIQAGATRATLDTLCLVADSTRGHLCLNGDWSPRAWNATADLRGVPVATLPRFPLDSFTTSGRFAGTLGAHAEGHGAAGRMYATVHATSDTIAFVYQDGADTTMRRLALDSAAVDVEVDSAGLRAGLAFRILSDRREAAASLRGMLALPGYRIGAPSADLPLTASLTGSAADISLLRPLLPTVDTLAGSFVFNADVRGTVAAPAGEAMLTADRMLIALDDGREAGGRITMHLAGSRSAAGIIGHGEVRPEGLYYGVGGGAAHDRLFLSGEGLRFAATDDGIEGSLDLRAAATGKGKDATLTGTLALPGYHGSGAPLTQQQIDLALALDLPDLALFQSVTLSADSLAGQVAGSLAVKGTIGRPDAKGEMRVRDGRARLPSGTLVEGGAHATLAAALGSDSSVTLAFELLPDSLRLQYSSSSTGRASILTEGSRVTISAGSNGLRGGAQVKLQDARGTALAALDAELAIPAFRRWDSSFAALPLTGTVTGRADDLAFLPAFTAQVDSAGGQLVLAGSMAGTPSRAHLRGDLSLTRGVARLPLLGILVHDANFRATGDDSGGVAIDASMRSGAGTLTVKGHAPLTPGAANPGTIEIQGENFTALGTPEMRAVLSPALHVKLVGDSIAVTGEVRVSQTHLTLTEIPESAVGPSDDIVLTDSVTAVRSRRPVSAEVRVILGDSVSFRGFNFNAEFGGTVILRQRPEELPTGTGVLTIREGRYKAYGQDLTIHDGAIRFAGGPVENPAIDMRASRTADDGTVAGIDVKGTLKTPRVTLFSEPALAQSEILSYILTGRAVGQGSGSKGSFVTRTLNSLGLKGSNLLASSIGKGIGLDEARIETEGDIRNASFIAGRYLAPSLYVSYGIGIFDPFSTLRLRYAVSRDFTLEAAVGRASGADLKVRIQSKTP